MLTFFLQSVGKLYDSPKTNTEKRGEWVRVGFSTKQTSVCEQILLDSISNFVLERHKVLLFIEHVYQKKKKKKKKKEKSLLIPATPNFVQKSTFKTTKHLNATKLKNAAYT